MRTPLPAASRALALLPLIAALVAPPVAAAHESQFGIGAKSVLVDTRKEPAKHKFVFSASSEILLNPAHDPAATGSAVLVEWTGQGGTGAGRTELIQLDPASWRGLGSPAGTSGYKYVDKTQSAGGIKKVLFKPGGNGGKLKIVAKGENWPWELGGPNDLVRVRFQVEDEWFCVEAGGLVKKNESGLYKATSIPAPASCPTEVCGNGQVDLGEECDDGNLDDLGDACANDCTLNPCAGGSYDSTFAAIQSVVFDGYGCTNGLCHGAATQAGGLDLTTANAYANLVSVSSTVSPLNDRVVPGEPVQSVLYDKLAALTNGTSPAFGGSPMPVGGPALTSDHLEAMYEWIRGGAPENTSVSGTAELLATCLPDPEPLIIPPLDPPAAGTGVQFRQTPWPLPQTSEDEICMATYYDFTGTGLVPAGEQVNCAVTTHNPTGKCFRWHRQVLAQDPQSHHSIIQMYGGTRALTHSAWGTWTYKFQDDTNPLEGTTCDPSVIDPVTGYNPDCSSRIVSGITCATLGGGAGVGGAAFSGSQEPYIDEDFADGVYATHPMAGIILWNSHAFNLTQYDSTMSQYLNLDFAAPADQLYPAQAIFQSSDIFVMNNTGGIPAFQTEEYCSSYTAPSGSTVFRIGSHTHRTGVRFRVWSPPNSSCTPGISCPPGSPGQLLYTSTDYADPLSLDVDMYFPPGTSSTNRRFRFCSLYDNGSTPSSPAVKVTPNNAGSPCTDRSCNVGPNQGNSCSVDSTCDSSPGAGDGECNACSVRGGFTTQDEMFILTGNYY